MKLCEIKRCNMGSRRLVLEAFPAANGQRTPHHDVFMRGLLDVGRVPGFQANSGGGGGHSNLRT